ncbi:hypothetical protein P43SY_002501 [Pythium insidiosum]|uniref:Condensin-2 complex subunit G2 n=1 Tax=Pythium insidiosum TaxID=114742 RepID=A0AAD5Q3E9_PYTIN|nr:hypothetical protein P43SY_002501 [Pythium insidiosum]
MTMDVAKALRCFCEDEMDAAPLAAVLEVRRQQLRRRTATKAKARQLQPADGDDAADSEQIVDEQIHALPRSALLKFCDVAAAWLAETLDASAALSADELAVVDSIATFCAILVTDSERVSADPARVFAIAETLHDHLLSIKGDGDVPATQDAVAQLCEACWQTSYLDGAGQTLVTQLLPYLIVRSYESQQTDTFNSKRHPIRRLYAIKDALLLLDFDDDSSSLLRDILLRCFLQPNFFRSPDAVPFLAFLFHLHVPFISSINATIRNQIPNQRKSIVKKFGAIYFKAWVGSQGETRARIEEDCIQRFVHDAVHASSLSLFSSVRNVLQIFFENKRHAGVDEMLYRISSPILWRGVKAANDSVRRQAAILLFDNFPLRDPQFNHEAMDRALQKQFDAFEELLEDSHPAVRIAAISGVAKVLSVYWELLPAETIRCFISKLVVDLVNDASSSAVRAAVFEGVQFILDNHNAHAILKPLLPMLAPLIHDRNERVRAEFAALLVRIKSIRNLHFYDIVPVNDLLDRLVVDRECPLVRKQLVLLFLNSYFPQSVGGSSQVARCLSLVKKHPEAAMVFYGHVADHASVGSVCKLAALLCRCSLNFVSKRLKKEEDVDDDEDDDDDDDEEESFSVVGRIVILEIMVSLLKSVHVKVLNDDRYAECKTFLAQQLSAEALKALIVAYSTDHPFDAEALRAIWKIAGYLGDIVQEPLLEPLVAQLMATNEASSKPLVDAMVECLAKWHQLPSLVSKVEDVLLQWRLDDFVLPTAGSKSTKNKGAAASYRLHPIVALSAIEYVAQISTVPCPKHLLDRLLDTVQRCATPLMELSTRDLVALVGADGENVFGVLRLLEVYAKLLVVVEAAHTTSQTALLFESSTLKLKTLDAATRAALRSLQPSGFFSPPEALAQLLQWVTRVLMDLHVDKEASYPSGANKKGTKKRSRRGENASNSSDGGESNWVARWRNLFSLTAMLATECAAFSLEHKDSHEVVAPFLDAMVTALADAATRHADADRVNRAVVLQASHLLFLLEKKAPNEKRWTEALKTGLRAVHSRHATGVEDLLAPLSTSLDLDDKESEEQEVDEREREDDRDAEQHEEDENE